MSRKGLGKGLDSLIPDFYDDEFDSNSTQSLEDMLNQNEEEGAEEETKAEKVVEGPVEKVIEKTEPEVVVEKETSSEDDLKVKENVAEVKEIVEKNPRITLWSSQSAAVFRYLRKTEPEFSISKEASTLIDEAVSKKYPDIWELFDE